jgi:hypothetical protein
MDTYGYGKLRCRKVRKEGNSRVKVGQGYGSAGGYKECETPGVSLFALKFSNKRVQMADKSASTNRNASSRPEVH